MGSERGRKMTKAILISKSPQKALNILTGKATLDLNKNVPENYVGWVYMYITKGKPYLYRVIDSNVKFMLRDWKDKIALNGRIVARWWHDEYDTLEYRKKNDVLMWDDNYYYYTGNGVYNNLECMLYELQLEHQQVFDYGKGKDLYAWHIKELEIFDKPMELGEFQNYLPKANDIPESCITSSWQIYHQPLTKAPQSWQYVYIKE